MLTPYQFASNSPVANSDLDGLEAKLEIYNTDKEGNVWLSVTDKFDLYNRTYKNGQLNGAQKVSQQQFNKTLNVMWQTFTEEKTAGYMVQGFDQYRSNASMTVSGTQKHNDQSQGTLTIASTNDNYIVALYDPTVVKQRKPVTFKESYEMAMKAKDVFFSNPDPLVEGSAAFKQTFDNFLTTAGIVVALPSATLEMGIIGIGARTSLLNSLDDLSSNTNNKRETFLQSSLGKSSANEIKTGMNITSFSGGLKSISQKGLNGPDLIGGSLDVKSILSRHNKEEKE
jgi:hypothetical protein